MAFPGSIECLRLALFLCAVSGCLSLFQNVYAGEHICPEGYYKHDGTCYRVVKQKKNYQEAEASCANDRGHLVSIHNSEEAKFYAGKAREAGMFLWIGLHDTSHENHFQWTDGTLTDFMNWAPGQPNNWFNEDCAHLQPDTDKWNDLGCSSKQGYICQRLMEQTAKQTASASDDSNIVGEPTFFHIDIPLARQRRQAITNTSVPTTANGTGITEATPSGPGVTTQTPKTGTTASDAVTEKATTQNATVAVEATTRVAATKAVERPVIIDGPVVDDGTIHWAAHNETYSDDHLYYKVKYVPPGANPERYWVDIDNQPAKMKDSVTSTINTRRAKLVILSFPFEFYGQDISKLLVTTGGFLYVGTYIHRYLAATQYIAPLMGNFDPSVTANASIRYADNGTAFTAEWRSVALADKAEVGEFTFQTTLFKDGRIVFAYQQVPITVDSINTEPHPVRIGLADAYYNDTFLSPLLKKRSIYEYHKVEVNFTRVISNMAIEISPNPTCHDMTDCHSCASSNISFDCGWCPAQGRCSSGFDRFRQAWVKDRCDIRNITVEADCNRPNIYDLVTTKPMNKGSKVTSKPSKAPKTCVAGSCNNNGQCLRDKYGTHFCQCVYPWKGTWCDFWQSDQDEDIEYIPHLPGAGPKPTKAKGSHFSYGGVLFIIILLIVLSVLLIWIVYAYRKPTSNSGIFLIELRSKLRRKGSGESDIKYKYHKPEHDELAEHV